MYINSVRVKSTNQSINRTINKFSRSRKIKKDLEDLRVGGIMLKPA